MNSSMESRSNSENVCEYEGNLAILRELPQFREAPLDAIRAMAYLCRRMRYKAGDTLFIQGDEDHQAYYILDGELDLLRDNRVVGGYAKGAFIGGLALLADARRLFSLRARTPVYCLLLSRRKTPTDPEKAAAFLQAFSRAAIQAVVDWETAQLLDLEKNNKDFECSAMHLGVSLL